MNTVNFTLHAEVWLCSVLTMFNHKWSNIVKKAIYIPGCSWPWPCCTVAMVTNGMKKMCCFWRWFPQAESWNQSSIITYTQTLLKIFFFTLPEKDSGCCSSLLPCQLHELAALWHSYPVEGKEKNHSNEAADNIPKTRLEPLKSPTFAFSKKRKIRRWWLSFQ